MSQGYDVCKSARHSRVKRSKGERFQLRRTADKFIKLDCQVPRWLLKKVEQVARKACVIANQWLIRGQDFLRSHESLRRDATCPSKARSHFAAWSLKIFSPLDWNLFGPRRVAAANH